MSIEVLSKNTADIFHSITANPQWDKMQIQDRIGKVLLQARNQVNSPEEYLASLLENVTFQYAYTSTCISFLAECIDEEEFQSQEMFHAILTNVPEQLQESNYIEENMPNFKELVYQGSNLEEQVLHAETVYFHTKLINDLLIEFVGTFLHPNNREYMANYLEYHSQVVVDAVMSYCQSYSNHIIEELNKVNSAE